VAKAKTERAAGEGRGTEALRRRLTDQRQEIVSLYQSDLRAGQASADEGTDDIVDRANNSYNREFLFSLSNNERQMLLLVDEALARMEQGVYGRCVNCGEEISRQRLEAVPWARFCIDCQELKEKGLLDENE
jgi:RNA polymerase-binding transcription factor